MESKLYIRYTLKQGLNQINEIYVYKLIKNNKMNKTILLFGLTLTSAVAFQWPWSSTVSNAPVKPPEKLKTDILSRRLNTDGCMDPVALNYDEDATTDDSSCEYCEGGTQRDVSVHISSISSLSGIDGCELCTPGKFSTTVENGHSSCVECSIGKFQGSEGALNCDHSSPGTFVAGTGAISASICLSGTFASGSGNAACYPSGAGHYSATPTQRTPCPAGHFAAGSANAACDPADIGHYVATTGQSAQVVCPLGQYQDQSGQTSCKTCTSSNKQYSDTIGSSECSQITDDTYCSAFSDINGCTAADIKQCVCPTPGVNGTTGRQCHFNGGVRCKSECNDATHYYHLPIADLAHTAGDIAQGPAFCKLRGSLTVSQNAIDGLNVLVGPAVLSSDSVSASDLEQFVVDLSTEFDVPSNYDNTELTADQVSLARTTTELIMSGVEPGHAILVRNDQSWLPQSAIQSSSQYKQQWKPITLLINPKTKPAENSDLVGPLNCDVDLYTMRDTNYKVHLSQANDRSVKCWDGKLKTLVTLLHDPVLGEFSSYTVQCYKDDAWHSDGVDGPQKCDNSGEGIDNPMKEGDCFICPNMITSNFADTRIHRSFIFSDSGSVNDETNCILATEKIKLANGEYTEVGRLKTGDTLASADGRVTKVVRVMKDVARAANVYDVECTDEQTTVTGRGRITGEHAYFCNGKWHHPQSTGLVSTGRQLLDIVSVQTSNYCRDKLILKGGLVVEPWDGREPNERRPHVYEKGNRMKCING